MIDKLISKRVKNIEAYNAENKTEGIILDKNENPWNLDEGVRERIVKMLGSFEYNRYPDSSYTELKRELSAYAGVSEASVVAGNGSDELIQMVMQTVANPGDTVATQCPTFAMYKLYGSLCSAEIKEYMLGDSFDPDVEGYISFLKRENPKAAIICNPNNPTGRIMKTCEIEKVLKEFSGLLVVDEAYYEFSGITAVGLLDKYENLIILRTLSKAFGLAGLRVGYLIGNPKLISYIERIRSPYNINSFSQAAAVEALKNRDKAMIKINLIKEQRNKLTARLTELENLECIESWSNFILVRSQRTKDIYMALEKEGIHVKAFSSPIMKNCLRITVGTPEQNESLYKVLKEVLKEND